MACPVEEGEASSGYQRSLRHCCHVRVGSLGMIQEWRRGLKAKGCQDCNPGPSKDCFPCTCFSKVIAFLLSLEEGMLIYGIQGQMLLCCGSGPELLVLLYSHRQHYLVVTDAFPGYSKCHPTAQFPFRAKASWEWIVHICLPSGQWTCFLKQHLASF